MKARHSFAVTGVAGITVAQAVALLGPSVVAADADPTGYLRLLTTTLVTAFCWEAFFSVTRARSFGFHGVTTALVVAVLIPADLPIWQLIFAMSLGIVLAELIFGGRGFGFISPASVSMSLLLFSFPQVELAQSSESLAIATMPGAALLLFLGLISWRVIVAALVAVAALIALTGQELDLLAVSVLTLFGLVFLICDPTAAATTNPGRWIYGLLAGGLVFLFSPSDQLTTEAVIFASLTASIFAPLIDHIVVLAHATRRGTNHA